MTLIVKYMALGILVFGCACHPKRTEQKPGHSTQVNSVISGCEMKATLEKHPGSPDDCLWILVLEEGERVVIRNPLFLNRTYKDGDFVKIGFKWLQSNKTLCHRAEAMIKLECIELLEDKIESPVKNCVNTIDVFDIAWMNDIMIKFNPLKVVKYDFEDNLAYRFIANDKELIYDCFGNLLCEDKVECGTWMSELKNPKVILVVNFNE